MLRAKKRKRPRSTFKKIGVLHAWTDTRARKISRTPIGDIVYEVYTETEGWIVPKSNGSHMFAIRELSKLL